MTAPDVEDAEQRLGLQRHSGRAAQTVGEQLTDDVDL